MVLNPPSKNPHPVLDNLQIKIPDPQWGYNPSAWNQRIPVCIIAMFGVAIASYLALFQWQLIDSIWDPFFGDQSERVIDSSVSHTMWKYFGAPDAAVGAFAYLGDAVFGLAGSERRWQYRPWMVILFGIDVIPLGIVSALLVVTQGFILELWCTLCLASAAVSLILVILAYDEVWLCLLYLQFVRKKRKELFWKVFWGKRPSVELEEDFIKYREGLDVGPH